MKFKKTVTVDAVQWDGTIESWWNIKCLGLKDLEIKLNIQGSKNLWFYTSNGHFFANEGEWIVKDSCGEFYKCTAEEFSKNYESVKE